MSAPLQLVVFDMAGTTVHDENFVAKALVEAMTLHGHPVSVEAANSVMGIAKPIAISMLLAQSASAEDAIIQRIHASFLEIMIRFYAEAPGVREMEGASETFRHLKSQGIKVALDTGFSRDITDAILTRLNWHNADLLDTTVTSDEVARGRPYADMVLEAMHRTGVTNSQAVAKVGDTIVDLQQGDAAGCRYVIGVLTGANTQAELEQQPHTHIVPSVREIPALLAY